MATVILGAGLLSAVPAVGLAQDRRLSSQPRGRDPRRLHDAARSVRGDHPALPGHRGRPGRHVRGVVRTVRRPEPPGGGRLAGGPRRIRAVAGRRAAHRAGHRAPRTGTRTRRTASSTTASWRSPSDLATPRGSGAGTISSARMSTSSRRTRSHRVVPSGTSWLPTRRRSRPARRRRRRGSSCKQLIANVSVMDRGARDALTTFMSGPG